jgi:aspartate aminotransferase
LGAALTEAESRRGCRVTLIADETHRDFTREGEFESVCTLYDRTILVYSFGKYHFMQGQRIGYAAVSPRHPNRDEVAAEMVRWTRITGIATPTSLMQRTVPKLLELKHNQDWLLTWRARFLEELRAYGLTVVQPDATMFVYVENPTPFEDFELVEALASKGLLVLPAAVFNHAGYFRLSLTGSESMLERALPTLRDFVTS